MVFSSSSGAANAQGRLPVRFCRISVRAAFPEEARHLVDERPGERPGGDEHLPARLDLDTGVDEDACVLLEPRVGHL
jgi:hypothetical protein